MFTQAGPKYGVIAEPTQLVPVYAHKGGCQITVTAYGQAAHTSTDAGYSANFQLAPFLAEMAELAPRLRSDPRFYARTPGELLAIAAILVCGLFVMVDIGRPERFWHILPLLGTPNLCCEGALCLA